MNWSQLFTSSVGKKITMAVTGIFLICFLVVHAGLNICVWANDGGVMFEKAAHFMGHNWVIRVLEVGLFLFLIIHIVQGLMLEMQNRGKRGSVGYKVGLGNRGSKWYSRSMGLLGVLILLFLIAHLYHFWIPTRSNQGWIGLEERDPLKPNAYEGMKLVFSNLGWVLLYVVGVSALFWHLMHGFQSAFRTLGVTNARYVKLLSTIGVIYSVVICLTFIMMPLSFYFGWVG
ncbi:MAG: succinate dehydrogenase cytochrome b subunit [Niabella sp.]